MTNKRLIAIIITFFVLGILFFIFFVFKDKPEVEQSPNFVEMAGSTIETKTKVKAVKFEESKLTAPEPIFEKFYDEFVEKTEEFIPFEELEQEFVEKEKEKEEEPGVVSQEIQLLDEEYFDLFYPENYIDYLNAMQRMMVEGGYIDEGEVIIFGKEEDVYPVLVKIIDYVADEEYITEEERLNFKNGVEELKILNKIERPYVIEQLLGILISKAYAFGGLCFRSGAGGPGGFNGWAWCCNCGMFCTTDGCIFMPDCGPGGSRCNVQFGCLNRVCPSGPAIWDPMTGICGCG